MSSQRIENFSDNEATSHHVEKSPAGRTSKKLFPPKLNIVPPWAQERDHASRQMFEAHNGGIAFPRCRTTIARTSHLPISW